MTVELEVPEEVAENVVEEMENKSQRMENVLQSFRSNNLIELKSYESLLSEQKELERDIEDIEEQIEDNKPDGLGELFG